MLITTNGFLKDILSCIELYSNDKSTFKDWLRSNGLELNTNPYSSSLINWDLMSTKYSMVFEFDNNEVEIENMFSSSILKDYNKIIVDVGYDEPTFIVEMSCFIKNWYSFFSASGYCGIVGITEDGKYCFELSDKEFILYSNFVMDSKLPT